MKLKTIQVPVFKRGNYVKVTDNAIVGTVLKQVGLITTFRILNGSTWTRNCDQLTLLTKAEFEKAKPVRFSVPSLQREIILREEKLIVGCQTINKADALKIAAFITKHLGK